MHDLIEVLEESQRRGFLGPGPVQEHVAHAHAFGQALGLGGSLTGGAPLRPIERILDLGSGGGIPGLVLLTENPNLRGVLLDGSVTRCAFLSEAVEALHMKERVEVWVGGPRNWAAPKTNVSRLTRWFPRSFGPPAQAVECGVCFLRPGGRMVISEPPGGRKWPADELHALGIAIHTFPGVAAPGCHR